MADMRGNLKLWRKWWELAVVKVVLLKSLLKHMLNEIVLPECNWMVGVQVIRAERTFNNHVGAVKSQCRFAHPSRILLVRG